MKKTLSLSLAQVSLAQVPLARVSLVIVALTIASVQISNAEMENLKIYDARIKNKYGFDVTNYLKVAKTHKVTLVNNRDFEVKITKLNNNRKLPWWKAGGKFEYKNNMLYKYQNLGTVTVEPKPSEKDKYPGITLQTCTLLWDRIQKRFWIGIVDGQEIPDKE